MTKKNLLRKGKRKREYHQVTPARATRGESIENRPKEAAVRTTFGHWEMDAIIGKMKTKSVLLCLTERRSRQEIVIEMPDKTTACCVKTINVDNDCEFQNYEGIERLCLRKQKRTKLYFCHLYSNCECGSNENQNGMIRRFFPKDTNFDKIKADDIQRVAYWINAYQCGVLAINLPTMCSPPASPRYELKKSHLLLTYARILRRGKKIFAYGAIGNFCAERAARSAEEAAKYGGTGESGLPPRRGLFKRSTPSRCRAPGPWQNAFAGRDRRT